MYVQFFGGRCEKNFFPKEREKDFAAEVNFELCYKV